MEAILESGKSATRSRQNGGEHIRVGLPDVLKHLTVPGPTAATTDASRHWCCYFALADQWLVLEDVIGTRCWINDGERVKHSIRSTSANVDRNIRVL